MADRPISSKKSGLGGGCVALFFSVFLLAGLAFLYLMFLKPVYQAYQARDWVEAPCTIMASDVKRHSSSDGTTYSVEMRFRYYVDDVEYESDRYEFLEVATGGRSGKAAIVDRYPVGHETTCFVDPSDPESAVIHRGLNHTIWFAFIPLIFVVVGGGGIYFSLRKSKGNQNKSKTGSGSRRWGRRPAKMPGTDGGASGPATLKPKATPLGKFIGLTFFALFWNGIVSVFLFQVFKAWNSGRGSWMEKWFLPIFLIPFVLIGLFVIGMAFHSLLAIFNPRTRLTLAKGTVPLGGTVNVQWQVLGRVSKLSKLTLYVEGREEATYRRGTRTHTAKEVFKTIEIAEFTDVGSMQSGNRDVTVPLETMHSFESSNNKVIWSIHLKGEIPKWPDIDDEYPLKVGPVAI